HRHGAGRYSPDWLLPGRCFAVAGGQARALADIRLYRPAPRRGRFFRSHRHRLAHDRYRSDQGEAKRGLSPYDVAAGAGRLDMVPLWLLDRPGPLLAAEFVSVWDVVEQSGRRARLLSPQRVLAAWLFHAAG